MNDLSLGHLKSRLPSCLALRLQEHGLCEEPALCCLVAFAEGGEAVGGCEDQPGTGQGGWSQRGISALGALSRTWRVARALWALKEQPAAGEAFLCEYRK